MNNNQNPPNIVLRFFVAGLFLSFIALWVFGLGYGQVMLGMVSLICVVQRKKADFANTATCNFKGTYDHLPANPMHGQLWRE